MSLSITFEKITEDFQENQITLSEFQGQGTNPITIGVDRRGFPSTPRILVLTRLSELSEYLTAIRSRMNALGYVENSTYFLGSASLTNTYSGAGDLDAPYQYNTVLINTNSSSQGATGLGGRLNAFMAAGNNLVFSTFAWSIPIAQGNTNFSYVTYSPLTYISAGQSTIPSNQTFTVDVVHPITTGLNLNMGTNRLRNNNATRLTATKISSWSDNTPAIAVMEVGSSRIVATNFYPDNINNATFVNGRNILVNSILWVNYQI